MYYHIVFDLNYQMMNGEVMMDLKQTKVTEKKNNKNMLIIMKFIHLMDGLTLTESFVIKPLKKSLE